jgi:hypothetical protein
MGELLGWSETVRAEEIARYVAATDCKPGAKNSSSLGMAPPNVPEIHPVA